MDFDAARRALWAAAEAVVDAMGAVIAGDDDDSDGGGSSRPSRRASYAALRGSDDDGDGSGGRRRGSGSSSPTPAPLARQASARSAGGSDGGHIDWAGDGARRGDGDDEPPPPPPPERLPPEPLESAAGPTPAMEAPSAILTPADAAALAAAVPARFRLARNARSLSPTLLVVRDARGAAFGAYAPAPWRPGARNYYGTGEAFVFSLRPGRGVESGGDGGPALPPPVGGAPPPPPPPRGAWRWHAAYNSAVARNDFFQLSHDGGLALGGGPCFALTLDAALARGRSGHSLTFGCPCLASDHEFEVGRVEVWALR